LEKGWFVPLEYVLILISAFVAILTSLWLGVVAKVFIDMEPRIKAVEAYADPRAEALRNELLMSQFKLLLADMESRMGRNLEAKRASIETTITSQVSEVVSALKKNGGAK
jgi:hypothetical protein